MFRIASSRGILQMSLKQTEQTLRFQSTARWNTCILFVPQQEAWVVERFGRYIKILEPGLNVRIPYIEQIKYAQTLKERAIVVHPQAAITLDNVVMTIDAVLYTRVIDPYKASYGVEDPNFAITQLAQTTMRSEIGKIPLDRVFMERESLNLTIIESLNLAAADWGITCMRYEIRDMTLPENVQEAMQMQVEAERKKRASVLESEGVRVAAINIAEGQKQSNILKSEAEKMAQINSAEGEAEAIIAIAEARAKSIDVIADSIAQHNGMNAVSMNIAEQYVQAFGNLAKEGNTVVLPMNSGDISGVVTQAMTMYNTLSKDTNKQLKIKELPPSENS